jgi:hypothetical protein
MTYKAEQDQALRQHFCELERYGQTHNLRTGMFYRRYFLSREKNKYFTQVFSNASTLA